MDRLSVRKLETVIVRGLSFLQCVLATSGAHPTSYSVGIPVFLRGALHSGGQGDYSPPASDKVKNEWRYASSLLLFHYGVFRHTLTCLFIYFPRALELMQHLIPTYERPFTSYCQS